MSPNLHEKFDLLTIPIVTDFYLQKDTPKNIETAVTHARKFLKQHEPKT